MLTIKSCGLKRYKKITDIRTADRNDYVDKFLVNKKDGLLVKWVYLSVDTQHTLCIVIFVSLHPENVKVVIHPDFGKW